MPFKTITWGKKTNEKEKCYEKLFGISSKLLTLVKNYFIWYIFSYSHFNHYLKEFQIKGLILAGNTNKLLPFFPPFYSEIHLHKEISL